MGRPLGVRTPSSEALPGCSRHPWPTHIASKTHMRRIDLGRCIDLPSSVGIPLARTSRPPILCGLDCGGAESILMGRAVHRQGSNTYLSSGESPPLPWALFAGGCGRKSSSSPAVEPAHDHQMPIESPNVADASIPSTTDQVGVPEVEPAMESVPTKLSVSSSPTMTVVA